MVLHIRVWESSSMPGFFLHFFPGLLTVGTVGNGMLRSVTVGNGWLCYAFRERAAHYNSFLFY